jgi:Ca2+-binding EF-hand superfamily protein
VSILLGIQKKFKRIDDKKSETLYMNEFMKAFPDLKIELAGTEIRQVFHSLDGCGSEEIDYDELVRGVRSPMRSFRKNITMAAFNKIDKDGSGIIDLKDSKGVYNAKGPSEVKPGKQTEGQIFR